MIRQCRREDDFVRVSLDLVLAVAHFTSIVQNTYDKGLGCLASLLE